MVLSFVVVVVVVVVGGGDYMCVCIGWRHGIDIGSRSRLCQDSAGVVVCRSKRQ